MKVAFFVNGFPIVSEPFVAQTAAALVEAGHDLRIYGIRNVKATGFSSSEKVQSLLAGRYENIGRARAFPLRLVGGISKVISSTLRHGAGAPLFKPSIYKISLKDLSAFYQTAILPADKHFDILHCQFATLGEAVLKYRLAGTLSGKVVIHFRGYDISAKIQSDGPEVYDDLWKEADHFVANCEFFKERIIQLGAPPEKVSVIGSAIDLSSFTYRPPRKISSNQVELVAVGRLIQRKGIHTLVEAIAILQRRAVSPSRRIHLIIIGGGPIENALKELARAQGVSEQVTFVGSQPHAVIAEHLRNAHVFIAASMKAEDGGEDAPVNTIKEAFAIGVPTVATNHGGIPELVIDGKTGVLTRENDPTDLARGIERIIQLKDQWGEMTLRARRKIEEEYEDGVILQKYENLYYDLLGHQRRDARAVPPRHASPAQGDKYRDE